MARAYQPRFAATGGVDPALENRVGTLETRLGSTLEQDIAEVRAAADQDGTLIVVETMAERALIESEIEADAFLTVVGDNTWWQRSGASWISVTRASVLDQILAAHIYGTLPDDTPAERARIESHIGALAGRTALYTRIVLG